MRRKAVGRRQNSSGQRAQISELRTKNEGERVRGRKGEGEKG